MSNSDPNDWNQQVINEFRENDGKVGGPFEGAPLLLLHHKGAKTGTERVTPLMYKDLDGRYAIFASKGGAPDNPDWFHNIVANPNVKLEFGSETTDADATVLEGDERDSVWEAWKAEFPQFAEYEEKTDREIPVILLEPAA
ncbi:MAG: nitroreductase family deazaflavin-dependent oxidoreductase [Thermomicrobiales bacterium]